MSRIDSLFLGIVGVLCIACMSALLSSGCSEVTEDDSRKLAALKERYGDKFDFVLEDQFYLRVKQRNGQADEKLLPEVYKYFFFDAETGERRNTSFVYLNLYDQNGKFRYQIAYDFTRNEFIRSQTEHY